MTETLGAAVVGCELRFVVEQRASLALQVAVARTPHLVEESLEITDSAGTVNAEVVAGDDGTIAHVLDAGPGVLTVTYGARVDLVPAPAEVPSPHARLVALRQSRYCPSDLLAALVDAELGDPGEPKAVADWVHRRLRYELGSSRPGDSAIDTLLSGQGVCRDFAHLTVALCRALDIPARFAAVYAPGLSPMDFHAVAEVAGPDGWEVLDATRLAPRPSLVRIATGRDAADTAFVTVFDGTATLEHTLVTAYVDGALPHDDHTGRVVLA